MSLFAGEEASESESSTRMGFFPEVLPEDLRLLPELGVIALLGNGKLKPWNWRRHSNAMASWPVEIPQESAISFICCWDGTGMFIAMVGWSLPVERGLEDMLV